MSRGRVTRGERALEMRLAGLTCEQIGKQLGIAAAKAFELVGGRLDQRAEATGVKYANGTLHLEIERLDAITALSGRTALVHGRRLHWLPLRRSGAACWR